jgi:putative endonuclease
MKDPYVYLLASARRGTLYVGVTSDLVKRIRQHREGAADAFATRHSVKRLVWFERHATMVEAIHREKVIKRWNRAWKLELIETRNPHWADLWDEILGTRLVEDHGFPLSRE